MTSGETRLRELHAGSWPGPFNSPINRPANQLSNSPTHRVAQPCPPSLPARTLDRSAASDPATPLPPLRASTRPERPPHEHVRPPGVLLVDDRPENLLA